MRHWLCVSIAALLNLTLAPVMADMAHAQQVECASTEALDKALREKFGEIPAIQGLTSSGARMTLYINPSSRTWTILMGDDANSCKPTYGTGITTGDRQGAPS
jgi:hypothetical protein